MCKNSFKTFTAMKMAAVLATPTIRMATTTMFLFLFLFLLLRQPPFSNSFKPRPFQIGPVSRAQMAPI